MFFQIILIVLNLFVKCYCEDSGLISFQAQNIVTYQKEALNISCRLATAASNVYAIELSKISSGVVHGIVVIAYSSLAGINNNYRRIIWSDVDLETRAEVTESTIYPASTAHLVFIIPHDKMKCSDNGTYKCTINGMAGNTFTYSVNKTVEISVEASTIDLVNITPNNCNILLPGITVNLTCNGTVGNPPADLNWCYKRNGQDDDFISYPVRSDIMQDNANQIDCQYSRHSILSYTTSNQWPEVAFVCVAGSNGTCSSFESISNEYILYTSAGPLDINSNQKDACTRNVLSGHCQLPNSTLVDTVYYIKLSRHTSSPNEDILTLSLDPPTNQTVLWHSIKFTNKASIDGSSIYPPREAKLVFYLNPDYSNCDDSGMYTCSISALSDTGRRFTEEITLHQNFTACTCSKAGQINGHPGILAPYVSIVMCQVFIIYMHNIF